MTFKRLFNLNGLLYLSLILALFASLSHVAYAFSTVNNNDMAAGYISAIAIDLGLLALAYGINLRKSKGISTKSLWGGVAFFSIISVYANWLSGIAHVKPIDTQVSDTVQWLVSLRPVILSAVLPILVIYLSEIVSGNDQRYQEELAKEERKAAKQVQKPVSLGPSDTGSVATVDPLAKANESRQAQIDERREQVLTLLNDGKTQPEIAEVLDVSLATVKRDTRALNGKVFGPKSE